MNDRSIAYFSMEIAVEDGIPTYSGGLGVLAGDTLRSAADLKIPMVAISLLHRKGYFFQKIDHNGWQTEQPAEWVINDFLSEEEPEISISIENRKVRIRAWRYEITGVGGYKIPVYLLDSDLAGNSEWDRSLTHFLYGGDEKYRFCQEVILGIGGVRILRAIGYNGIKRFHMNEGHAALLALELLDEEAGKAGRNFVSESDIKTVKNKCVFTTHTPVPAGHDQFPFELFSTIFQDRQDFIDMRDCLCVELANNMSEHKAEPGHIIPSNHVQGKTINMTYLALNLSHYVNGVAKKHGEVSRSIFPGHVIDAITNGVHAATWVSWPFRDLYNRYIAGWCQDNFSLRYALGIPPNEIWGAHMKVKKELISYVNREANAGMDKDVLTLCFARRMTAYKRADLIFSDIERLKNISKNAGSLQLIFAGKAHPKDQEGKQIIRRILDMKELLKAEIRISYLPNYDMRLAKMLVSGGDVWMNTPQPPMEASGTSGMKAALNGVPSFSILDGWWIEGCIEGVTGWSIEEEGKRETANMENNALSLYEKLEHSVIPAFYNNRDRFIEIMRHAIALNGSFFNTQRMLQQYVTNAYFL
ncbi:MAG: alpha-glucan family phosphorylase [Desulfobacterales bacterium]